jgi:hypothetical protein
VLFLKGGASVSVYQNRFKSPIVKIAAFFEKSRDQWKEKYIASKTEVRAAKHRLRAVETSRENWRQRALAAEKLLKKI